MESPIKYFASMQDHRLARKRLHDLKDIIAITIAAVICGASDWYEIADYGQKKQGWFKTFLALANGIPSHDTFNRFFAMADSKALEQCFVNWVNSVAKITQGSIVSIDGKCLRGSAEAKSQDFIHMVSAWCNTNNMVLAQQKVNDKSNEITAIPALLEVLFLQGCLVTIDAMGCQTAVAEKIVDKQADYILAVKGNQKVLEDDIKEAFGQGGIEDEYTQKEVGHGRIEVRTTSVIKDLDWICNKEDWKKLACIVMVFCRRIDKKTGSEESSSRYYISSKNTSAKEFGQAIRSHWQIENKLHWLMDVAFGEDQSRKQAGNAAQNFSLISKVALNMIRNHEPDVMPGSKKISVKRKRLMAAWDNDYLLSILLSF